MWFERNALAHGKQDTFFRLYSEERSGSFVGTLKFLLAKEISSKVVQSTTGLLEYHWCCSAQNDRRCNTYK